MDLIVGKVYIYTGFDSLCRTLKWVAIDPKTAQAFDGAFAILIHKWDDPSSIFTAVTVNSPNQQSAYNILSPGDKLRLKRDLYGYRIGDMFEIVSELNDNYVVRGYSQAWGLTDSQVSKIDIWNWYDIWTPEEEKAIQEASEKKPKCTHKFVNVGFNTINMACKYCGVAEEDGREKERYANEYGAE